MCADRVEQCEGCRRPGPPRLTRRSMTSRAGRTRDEGGSRRWADRGIWRAIAAATALGPPESRATSTRKPQPVATLGTLDEARITVIFSFVRSSTAAPGRPPQRPQERTGEGPEMRKRSPAGLREHVTGAARGWPSCEEKDHDAATTSSGSSHRRLRGSWGTPLRRRHRPAGPARAQRPDLSVAHLECVRRSRGSFICDRVAEILIEFPCSSSCALTGNDHPGDLPTPA